MKNTQKVCSQETSGPLGIQQKLMLKQFAVRGFRRHAHRQSHLVGFISIVDGREQGGSGGVPANLGEGGGEGGGVEGGVEGGGVHGDARQEPCMMGETCVCLTLAMSPLKTQPENTSFTTNCIHMWHEGGKSQFSNITTDIHYKIHI